MSNNTHHVHTDVEHGLDTRNLIHDILDSLDTLDTLDEGYCIHGLFDDLCITMDSIDLCESMNVTPLGLSPVKMTEVTNHLMSMYCLISDLSFDGNINECVSDIVGWYQSNQELFV